MRMTRLKAYPIYLILTAATSFAFSVAFTTSAVYRYEAAGLDPLQLVLLGTALEAAVFLFEIPTGIVADLFSRRLSLIIGYAVIGLGMLLEGGFQLFFTILLAQVVWGIGYTFISGAQSAWLADELGEERLTAAFLRGSQVAQLATLAGIGANVLLANRQLNLPYFAGGLVHIVLALFLALFMPEHGFAPTPAGERDTWSRMGDTFRSGMQTIRVRPMLMTILGISFIYGLYSEALDRLWQPHFLDNVMPPAAFELSMVTWFGIITASTMVISVGVAEMVRRRTSELDPMRMTVLLALLSAVISTGLVVFGLARNFPVALAAFASVDIARTTLNPLFDAWTNRGLPSAVRATVLSTYGQMDAVGQVIGGPLVGVIANQAGLRVALVVAGLLLSPVLLLYRRAHRQTAVALETEPVKAD